MSKVGSDRDLMCVMGAARVLCVCLGGFVFRTRQPREKHRPGARVSTSRGRGRSQLEGCALY